MSREIRVFSRGLAVLAVDEPGPGGANHRYDIAGYDAETNPRRFDVNGHKVGDTKRTEILFQHGTIGTGGRNGVTEEALLTIVEDRLRSFQSGPYPCAENELALAHVERALEELDNRTSRRKAAGIEGQYVEDPIDATMLEGSGSDPDEVNELRDINARLLDILASIRDRLNIDEGESILDAMDERAKLIAELRAFQSAVLDPENQPTQFGTVLLATLEEGKPTEEKSTEGEQSSDPSDEQHNTDAGALGDSDGGKPGGEHMTATQSLQGAYPNLGVSLDPATMQSVNTSGQDSIEPAQIEPDAADEVAEQAGAAYEEVSEPEPEVEVAEAAPVPDPVPVPTEA